MAKDLGYYLGLHYDIILTKHETDDGEVSYEAYTNELPRLVFYGVGDSLGQALESLIETKAELFELYLEEKRKIPEPEAKPQQRSRTMSGISNDKLREIKEFYDNYVDGVGFYVKELITAYEQSQKVKEEFKGLLESSHNCIKHLVKDHKTELETANKRIAELENELYYVAGRKKHEEKAKQEQTDEG